MSIPPAQQKLDHGFGRGVDYRQEHAMTLHVDIPEPLAGKIAKIAQAEGKTPEDLVLDAVAQRLDDPLVRLNATLAPIRAAFQESGMTEDEAVEYFEQIKHERRRERRVAGK